MANCNRHFYRSKIADDDREIYCLYASATKPPRKRAYPVLYLLHGFSDDASGWTSAGFETPFIDNLIARKTSQARCW